MAFAWRPGRAYRFSVHRSPDVPGAWRADITDLMNGEATVIRDLMHPGRTGARAGRAGDIGADAHSGYLRRPVVWSEVFADCDAPSVVVRWSGLRGGDGGRGHRQARGRTRQLPGPPGWGLREHSVRRDEVGLLQLTNTAREIGQGARLDFRKS